MKLKVILMLLSFMLSACTLHVRVPAYVNAATGEQVYAIRTVRIGSPLPVITVTVPWRQMYKR